MLSYKSDRPGDAAETKATEKDGQKTSFWK